MGNNKKHSSCYHHKLNPLPAVRQWVAWRDCSHDIAVPLCSTFLLTLFLRSSVGSSAGCSPLGVCLLHHGAPPPPLTLVFPLLLLFVFPPPLSFQHFCPFSTYVFTAASPKWLMGLAVACVGPLPSCLEPAVSGTGAAPVLLPQRPPWQSPNYQNLVTYTQYRF